MTPRDHDDVIRAWFNDGPSRGTADGLERTLARLAATPQGARGEIRMPVWLPAAAVVALVLAAVLAFGAGFRIVVPSPLTSSNPSAPVTTTTGSCRIEMPVHGKDALLVGFGFTPDSDVVLEIDRANGTHVTIDSTNGAPHTDRTGGFFMPLRPFPEDLGSGRITAIAGCTATLENTVAAADLPTPCPDPGRTAPLVDGAAYRAAVQADRPIAWWPMEDSGDVAADAAGNHDGTYVGGQIEHAAFTPLSDGGSAWFHHQFPGLAIIELEPIVLDGDFSIETWMYFCHWADGDAIVGSTDSTAAFRIGEGELHLTNGSTEVLWAGEEVVSGAWQHLVVIRSGEALELYRDGVLDGSEYGAGWTGPFEVSLIGGTKDYDNFLGYLDEVALYDHALSPERIAAHARP